MLKEMLKEIKKAKWKAYLVNWRQMHKLVKASRQVGGM
jgi:hypothetical protein